MLKTVNMDKKQMIKCCGESNKFKVKFMHVVIIVSE